MSTDPKAPNSKILVQLWDLLLVRLNEKVEAACLRRDAFLDRAIQAELPHLDREIPTPNSAEARRAISDHLALLPRKSLTISLQKSTIAELDRICSTKNLVRDAVLNRLVFCLVASPKLVQRLFMPDPVEPGELRMRGWAPPTDYNAGQALPCIRDHVDGPFDYVRECMEVVREESEDETWWFWQVHFRHDLVVTKTADNTPATQPLSMFGLNVYLPDVFVPGTDAHKEHEKAWEELFASPPPPAQRTKESS